MKYQPPVGATDPNAPYAPRSLASGGSTGSRVPAPAVEHPQREIVNAITAEGLAPSNDLTQLAQLFAARAKSDLSNLATGALRLGARINIGTQYIFPEDFGVVSGEGVTSPAALAANAVALRSAFLDSVARGVPVRGSKNRLYRHGAFAMPPAAMSVGRLRLQPVVPAGDPSPWDVWIDDDCSFEDLIFEMPPQASSQNQESVIVKNRVQVGGVLAIRAYDGVLRDGSICFDGDEFDINDLRSKNIRRPFLVVAQSIRDGVSPIAPRRGWRIKDFRVDTFYRAFRLMGVADYSIPLGKTFGVATGATKAPGNNCFLIGGSKNGYFGTLDLADNQEHCIRGAHAPGYGDSVGNTFADITSRRSRGCVFKFNDGQMNTVDEDGVGAKAQWRKSTIGKVIGYDVGLGTGAGHGGSALIRASHTRETTVGLAMAIAQDTAYACWQLLQTTDNDGFIVECLTAHGLVRRAIDVTTNADWPGPTPDVRNIVIKQLNATLDGVSPAAIRFNLKPKALPEDADPDDPQTATPQGTVGDFRVLGGTISGCQYLAVCGTETIGEGGSDDETGDVTPIDGDIYLNVQMHGAGVSGGFYKTPPANSRVRLDVVVADGARTYNYAGRVDRYEARGFIQEGAELDVGDVSPQDFGPTVRGRGILAALNAAFTVLTAERPGSRRRAWVAVAEQDNAAEQRVGLAFYRTGGSASNALTRWFRFFSNGEWRNDVSGAGLTFVAADGVGTARIQANAAGQIVASGGVVATGPLNQVTTLTASGAATAASFTASGALKGGSLDPATLPGPYADDAAAATAGVAVGAFYKRAGGTLAFRVS